MDPPATKVCDEITLRGVKNSVELNREVRVDHYTEEKDVVMKGSKMLIMRQSGSLVD